MTNAGMRPRIVKRMSRLEISSRLSRAVAASVLVVAAFVGACAPGVEGPPPQIALAVLTAAPGTCTEWTSQPIERVCIPRMAMADAPLVFDIEERCGPCGATGERCAVSVEGKTVTLSLDGKTCEPLAGTSCSDVCGKNRVHCNVPALPEGRYQVRYADTGGRVDTIDIVSGRNAATTCSLDDSAR